MTTDADAQTESADPPGPADAPAPPALADSADAADAPDPKGKPPPPAWYASALSAGFVLTALSLGLALRGLLAADDLAVPPLLAAVGFSGLIGLAMRFHDQGAALSRRQRRLTARACVVALLVPVLWPRPESPDELVRESVRSELVDQEVVFGPGDLTLATKGILVADAVTGDPRPSDGDPVALSAFAIDRYEVTNELYLRCVELDDEQARCDVPDDGGVHRRSDAALLPVVGVDAASATQFCEWSGRRLPSDDEWLFAVRGERGAYWPWDEEPWDGSTPKDAEGVSRIANVMALGDVDPSAVEDPTDPVPSDGEAPQDSGFPPLLEVSDPRAGRTPDGIAHLLGNVWEWTATSPQYARTRRWSPDGDAETLVVRGHANTSIELDLHMFAPLAVPVETRDPDIGFRCARDLEREIDG